MKEKLEKLLELTQEYRSLIKDLQSYQHPFDIKAAENKNGEIQRLYAQCRDEIQKHSQYFNKVVFNEHSGDMWNIYVVAFSNHNIMHVKTSLDNVITDLNYIISRVDHSLPKWHVTFWSSIHPEIRKVSEELFSNWHYKNAVWDACTLIDTIVSSIYLAEKGVELHGQDLMQKAFNENDTTTPAIKLNKLMSETDRNEQMGYRFIFSWVMSAIRNPKAHTLDQITPERAEHLLYLLSLLRYKIDERLV